MRLTPAALFCALAFGAAAAAQPPPRPSLVPGTGAEPVPYSPGWDSEALSDAAGGQMKALAKRLTDPEAEISAAALAEICAPDFACSALRPPDLAEAFGGPAFAVRRAPADWKAEPDRRGAAALAESALVLQKALAGEGEHRYLVKVVEVRAGYTRAIVQLCGGGAQATAEWVAEWTGSEPPLLRSLRCTKYEEAARQGGPQYEDATAAAIGGTDAFREQLQFGIHHWLARIEMAWGIDVGGWQGVSVADVNGDGLEDVYAPQPGGLPNRLLLQNLDGTCRDFSLESGIDWVDATHAAVFADFDNDGDADCAVAMLYGLLISSNDGSGRFTLRAALPLPDAVPYSLAVADYDADGDLDVFAACYNHRGGVGEHSLFVSPLPYHDAQNGGRNALLRNDGGFAFRHASQAAGLDENNHRFSYAASWEDIDDDGDLDLYVANDFGRNSLYQNIAPIGKPPQFRDIAAESGTEDIAAGMSAAWGDYDADGRMDLYVANMFSSAGNRIVRQGRFLGGSGDGATRGAFLRHARGNSLFRNLGGARFADVSEQAGVTLGRWAWSSLFGDFNNDGYDDLFVANGFITQEDTGDL